MRRPALSLLLGLLVLGAGGPALAQVDAADEDAPAVTDSHLSGLDAAGVRLRLGEPALAREEGAGALWTYRLNRCVLFVAFADDGAGLRVTALSSGPRRHGEAQPETLACLREAEASRHASADALPTP